MADKDQDAELQFVSQWHGRIKAWVTSQTSPTNVEDYTQDVWCRLADRGWRRLLQWDGLTAKDGVGPNSLAGYLRTITRNRVSDLHDADKKHVRGTISPDDLPNHFGSLGTNPAHETERSIALAGGQECLDEFEAEEQTLLTMWALGHSDKAIAEVLGVTATKAKNNRWKLLRKLRNCLKSKFPDLFGHD